MVGLPVESKPTPDGVTPIFQTFQRLDPARKNRAPKPAVALAGTVGRSGLGDSPESLWNKGILPVCDARRNRDSGYAVNPPLGMSVA
jgi:hypothetical protein